MKKDIAESISKLMLAHTAALNESVRMVMDGASTDGASQDEFSRYRRAVGGLMAAMLIDVLDPIYREHPDLRPEMVPPPPPDPARRE